MGGTHDLADQSLVCRRRGDEVTALRSRARSEACTCFDAGHHPIARDCGETVECRRARQVIRRSIRKRLAVAA
jgi:hypothetical protein